ncbi:MULTISPECIES: class I adenylate-forming enzyme family protein [Sphingomonas]|uniref:class I adenylate-forming enzyme family protein n=1 Tax=Sphingomonas TaxID=13687 RepID=UPI0008347E85|nr:MULTISPECIES: AMP-binding protein [Sphingomonas]MBY0301196.1 AMP-binding protein [Sphingomonas ginsenosidimutans]
MQPTLLQLMQGHAERTPHAPCLACGDTLLTFRDLDRRSSALANVLAARGVGAGDRVALLAYTAPIFYELTYACAKLGAIMLPLNWRLSPREIGQILRDAEPTVMLVQDALARLLDDDGAPRIDLETLDRLTADASPEFAPRAVDPDAPTLLLYTSGTTGMPKGVLISQTNLSYVERMAREIWAFDAASINLVAMPLFHIGGIGYGMMALSQGGHTVLLDRLDPPSIVETVNRHGVTHSFFVPTVVQRLVDNVEAGGEAPRGLKRILYGAAPIGEPLLRRALALFGCEFSHAYGATETAGTVISLPPDQHDPDGPIPERLRSCGRPLPWVELTLVDPATGQPVATGEVGEIRIRSGMVTQGYWRKPDETAAAITADGWLKTGDAAYRDDDGYVFIHDRYKDMIVSGGENVYPTEIENVLGAHPAVGQVAVIGVAHPKWGETPRAYVVPRAGATPDEAEMIAFTRARLAHYKCPTSIRFVAELPQTASGKILKKDLREIDRVLEAKT